MALKGGISPAQKVLSYVSSLFRLNREETGSSVWAVTATKNSKTNYHEQNSITTQPDQYRNDKILRFPLYLSFIFVLSGYSLYLLTVGINKQKTIQDATAGHYCKTDKFSAAPS